MFKKKKEECKHEFVTEKRTFGDKEMYYRVCSKCGKEIYIYTKDVCDHDWVFDKEFDTEQEVSSSMALEIHVMVYKCSKCGQLKTIK